MNTISDISNQINNFPNIVKKTCKFYGKNCQNLYEHELIINNIKHLKLKFLSKTKSDLNKDNFNTLNIQNVNSKKVYFRIFDNGEIRIYNLTSELINIKDLEINSKKISLNKKILPSTFNQISKISTNIDYINFKLLFGSEVILNYTDQNNKIYTVESIIENKDFIYENLIMNLKPRLNFELINQTYHIYKGDYYFEDSLIVPEGYNLKIHPGVKIFMSKENYIMVKNGVLNISNETGENVEIVNKKDNEYWNGIYVFSKDRLKSSIHNLNLRNINYFDNGYHQLTGGLNFINTNILLKNIELDNAKSEDAINIINSIFKIDNVEIKNTLSDAIDLDFSYGTINNIKLQNIGGDGIDLSGSDTNIYNLIAENIGDKGISNGEESIANGENLIIDNAKIGIASKDGSVFSGNNITINSSNLFDLAAYNKKVYFNGGKIKVKNNNNFSKIISQLNSEIIINNQLIENSKFDTNDLY